MKVVDCWQAQSWKIAVQHLTNLSNLLLFLLLKTTVDCWATVIILIGSQNYMLAMST